MFPRTIGVSHSWKTLTICFFFPYVCPSYLTMTQSHIYLWINARLLPQLACCNSVFLFILFYVCHMTGYLSSVSYIGPPSCFSANPTHLDLSQNSYLFPEVLPILSCLAYLPQLLSDRWCFTQWTKDCPNTRTDLFDFIWKLYFKVPSHNSTSLEARDTVYLWRDKFYHNFKWLWWIQNMGAKS